MSSTQIMKISGDYGKYLCCYFSIQ